MQKRLFLAGSIIVAALLIWTAWIAGITYMRAPRLVTELENAGALPLSPSELSRHTAAYILHRQVVVWIAVFALFGTIPLWLASLLFRALRLSLKTHLIQAGAYVVGWALIILYTRIDPYRFAEWFFD